MQISFNLVDLFWLMNDISFHTKATCHGRHINPLRPQNWGTAEKQLKKRKNDDAQLQTHQTLKLSWSTHNENLMAYALGEVHKYYIWRNAWEKVMSR
jgi:hypothetical protein